MSLKKDLFSGVFYTAVARYSGLIVSLVIAGVLARLIPPEDFGIVAVATVIISFFGIFSDLGVGAAVIQNKTLTDGDLSKIYSFTLSARSHRERCSPVALRYVPAVPGSDAKVSKPGQSSTFAI